MLVTNFPYPWVKCKRGADLCFENADRLIRDAHLLLENERYVTCSCLAIYAIEEIGKGKKLSELFRTQQDLSRPEWERLCKGKAHIAKIEAGQRLVHEHLKKQFPQLRWNQAEARYEQAYKSLAEHYQWRKEKYLYVDLLNDDWIFPSMRPAETEAVLTLMVLTEAFEGCIALGKELGLATVDIEKRYDEFITLSFKIFARYIELPND
jgi:AbiV family abortive infection protein